jgi:hypothetical protein
MDQMTDRAAPQALLRVAYSTMRLERRRIGLSRRGAPT